MKRVVLSWSSGKDAAWALGVLRRDPTLEVVGLLSAFNAAFDRVAVHAVRRPLVEDQARAAGLPLKAVELPWPCPNEEYDRLMAEACASLAAGGVQAVAFGDLFLEAVRRYREQRLGSTGLEPLFPLWGLDTARLAREMLDGGLQAIVTCVDPSRLDPSYAGRAFDHSFLDSLPAGIDPCGENGEFHSFATRAPCFSRPVGVRPGETVRRDGFVFADLIPVQEPAA
jgi:uncharacterized protein (TIGR00290 family)